MPKVSVILRKAYGGAYIVMSSKHLRSDINLAWPSAEIAVMGPDGAVNIIYREQISQAEDAEAHPPAANRGTIRKSSPTPTSPAGQGFLDDVIDPAETRARIIGALEMLRNKRTACQPRNTGIYRCRARSAPKRT